MKGRGGQPLAYRCIAVSVLAALLLVPAVPAPARAQATAVRLQPSAAAVQAGQTVSVQVMVDNVTNLFGIEVHLVFDPTLLEVVDADAGMAGVQVALGPFLSVDYVPQNTVDQGTGHVDFAYSQMLPATGRSGSGAVATITFRGKAAGTSPLTFASVILADQGGNAISATTQNGQVVVGGTPTVTATPTGTPTPTATPTSPAGTVLTFSPQTVSVAVGQTVQVVLQVQGAANLYGIEAHLTHPAGIDATAIAPGPCLATLVALSSVAGDRIDYAASLQAPNTPASGTCNVATVTIRGVSPGTHTLHFTSALLSDPNGNPLPATVADGSVTVTGGTVTPTPTPAPPCQNILGYHVVQPGESLYAIGRAYGVRPGAIAACNNIVNPSRIYAGTRLAIPNVPWSPIPPGPVARRQFGGPVTPCRAYHTVQWGENLFRISLRYGVSMWAIAEANSIFNLHYIRANQVLCIP